MAHLTQRRLTPELMDEPDADPRELERALRFIQFVNRPFPLGLGGAGAALCHLKRWSHTWSRDRPVRILDVGTGTADIPLAILRWAGRAGHDVRITAVDLHETTLAIAQRHLAGGAHGSGRIELLRADALALHETFEPKSFDYAHAGMFLHHLHDLDVMTVLRIMDRLTTRGVIWNDLVRSPLSRAAIRALGIGMPRMVRHDAIASIDAGFTKAEALDLARRAGMPRPAWRRHLYYRFTVCGEKGG